MTHDEHPVRSHERWAHLRFAVVGPLLASPPPQGELQAELVRLAARLWLHPISGQPVRFAVSTLERWFYKARAGNDPVGVLRRQPRRDRGQQRAVGATAGRRFAPPARRPSGLELPAPPRQSRGAGRRAAAAGAVAVVRQPAALHGDAGVAAAEAATSPPAGARRARPSREFQQHEVRSYETAHVGGLWHLDFHHCSRPILSPQGEWYRPLLLCDPRRPLAARLPRPVVPQRDRGEPHPRSSAGLSQARPQPPPDDRQRQRDDRRRDGRGAGTARRRPSNHVAARPYQNGKQETFFSQVETRLIAMLEGRAGADPEPAQRGDARLDRARVPPHAPHRNRPDAPGPLSRRSLARPSLSVTVAELRVRLHRRGIAPAAPQRRHAHP